MLHAQNLEAAHRVDYFAQVTTDMLAGWHLHKDSVQYILRDNTTTMVNAMRVANMSYFVCMAHTHYNLLREMRWKHIKESSALLRFVNALSDTSNIRPCLTTLDDVAQGASLACASLSFR